MNETVESSYEKPLLALESRKIRVSSKQIRGARLVYDTNQNEGGRYGRTTTQLAGEGDLQRSMCR